MTVEVTSYADEVVGWNRMRRKHLASIPRTAADPSRSRLQALRVRVANAKGMSDVFFAPGDRVERRITLTHASIARVAADLGDANPLHHDEELARASRFGTLIASASHTIGLLLGLGGSQATIEHPGVGLAFTFELEGPARAGDELVLWWEIERLEPTPGGSNTLAHLRGGIDGADGRAILRATGTTLYFGAPGDARHFSHPERIKSRAPQS